MSSIVFITSKETPPELALLSHSITTVDSASRAILELDSADLVIVDGIEYHADGDSRDWTRGPWVNPIAGVQLELSRKRG